jgi:hypothetical protein
VGDVRWSRADPLPYARIWLRAGRSSRRNSADRRAATAELIDTLARRAGGASTPSEPCAFTRAELARAPAAAGV